MSSNWLHGNGDNNFVETIKSNNLRKESIDKIKQVIRQCLEQYFSNTSTPLTNKSNSDILDPLCTLIESFLIHKLKNPTTTTLWTIINILPTLKSKSNKNGSKIIWNEEFDYINSLSEVTSDVGKSRAWIRRCLNESILNQAIEQITSSHDLLRTYYEDDSIQRHKEDADIFKSILVPLDTIQFQIDYNDALLEVIEPQYMSPLHPKYLSTLNSNVTTTTTTLSSSTSSTPSSSIDNNNQNNQNNNQIDGSESPQPIPNIPSTPTKIVKKKIIKSLTRTIDLGGSDDSESSNITSSPSLDSLSDQNSGSTTTIKKTKIVKRIKVTKRIINSSQSSAETTPILLSSTETPSLTESNNELILTDSSSSIPTNASTNSLVDLEKEDNQATTSTPAPPPTPTKKESILAKAPSFVGIKNAFTSFFAIPEVYLKPAAPTKEVQNDDDSIKPTESLEPINETETKKEEEEPLQTISSIESPVAPDTKNETVPINNSGEEINVLEEKKVNPIIDESHSTLIESIVNIDSKVVVEEKEDTTINQEIENVEEVQQQSLQENEKEIESVMEPKYNDEQIKEEVIIDSPTIIQQESLEKENTQSPDVILQVNEEKLLIDVPKEEEPYQQIDPIPIDQEEKEENSQVNQNPLFESIDSLNDIIGQLDDNEDEEDKKEINNEYFKEVVSNQELPNDQHIINQVENNYNVNNVYNDNNSNSRINQNNYLVDQIESSTSTPHIGHNSSINQFSEEDMFDKIDKFELLLQEKDKLLEDDDNLRLNHSTTFNISQSFKQSYIGVIDNSPQDHNNYKNDHSSTLNYGSTNSLNSSSSHHYNNQNSLNNSHQSLHSNISGSKDNYSNLGNSIQNFDRISSSNQLSEFDDNDDIEDDYSHLNDPDIQSLLEYAKTLEKITPNNTFNNNNNNNNDNNNNNQREITNSNSNLNLIIDEYENQKDIKNTKEEMKMVDGKYKWTPVRKRLYFNIQQPKTLKDQNNQCFGCAKDLSGLFTSSRYCEYTGKYHCSSCHSKQTYIIPGRILTNWDFKYYQVSNNSKEFLMEIDREPLFDIAQINPKIYNNNYMIRIRNLRRQCYYIKDFLKTCTHGGKSLVDLVGGSIYLINDIDFYSLFDLVNYKPLLESLRTITAKWLNHIDKCELCLAKGSICEFCDDNHPIYPFHISKVSQCKECKSFHHKHCFVKTKCPKCIRLAKQRILQNFSAARKMEKDQELNQPIINTILYHHQLQLQHQQQQQNK